MYINYKSSEKRKRIFRKVMIFIREFPNYALYEAVNVLTLDTF